MTTAEPAPATWVPRPPLPSITGSALRESRMLVVVTRRALAALLARG